MIGEPIKQHQTYNEVMNIYKMEKQRRKRKKERKDRTLSSQYGIGMLNCQNERSIKKERKEKKMIGHQEANLERNYGFYNTTIK